MEEVFNYLLMGHAIKRLGHIHTTKQDCMGTLLVQIKVGKVQKFDKIMGN